MQSMTDLSPNWALHLTPLRGAALVQYNFNDNRLNIINYLGLFTGFCGASRPGSSYEDDRLILNDFELVFSQLGRLNPAQRSQLHNNPLRVFNLMINWLENNQAEPVPALLDGDRFEGRFRDGVHQADSSDLMRRLTKEELFKFDGRPLFPERRAYTVTYHLSAPEAALYAAVTTYVREEMNRVERFAGIDDQRKQNVGFALQSLQRRLASSPAAIHESLRRRRERLEKRLAEERLLARGRPAPLRPEDRRARARRQAGRRLRGRGRGRRSCSRRTPAGIPFRAASRHCVRRQPA